MTFNSKSHETQKLNHSQLIAIKEKEFQEKFERNFKIEEKHKKDKDLFDFPEISQFTREALSNLLGNIGYYYGPIKIL